MVPNSPAADAGLQAADQKVHFQGVDYDAGGDVIVAVNGQRIIDASDLPTMISRLDPGDTATLRVIRGGHAQDIDVKLGERPGG